jgi:glyoxylase-like metal-dependent hydrolase (beta-lactamase superfamily II)
VQKINQYSLDDLEVYRLISRYHNSNTYIVQHAGRTDVIVVDPGDPDTSLLIDFFTENEFRIHSVWLTHEHSDHCAGVNSLYNWQPFPLYCTAVCAQHILDSKRNFSAYIDEIETFVVQPKTTILDNQSEVDFDGLDMIILATPGHTKGSACFMLSRAIFTGDTLMKDFKTPLNFPGSDKEAYQKSITTLVHNVNVNSYVFPGHGNPFAFSEHPLIER